MLAGPVSRRLRTVVPFGRPALVGALLGLAAPLDRGGGHSSVDCRMTDSLRHRRLSIACCIVNASAVDGRDDVDDGQGAVMEPPASATIESARRSVGGPEGGTTTATTSGGNTTVSAPADGTARARAVCRGELELDGRNGKECRRYAPLVPPSTHRVTSMAVKAGRLATQATIFLRRLDAEMSSRRRADSGARGGVGCVSMPDRESCPALGGYRNAREMDRIARSPLAGIPGGGTSRNSDTDGTRVSMIVDDGDADDVDAVLGDDDVGSGDGGAAAWRLQVCLLEADNEKLRDEIAALRSRVAMATQGSPGQSLARERERTMDRVRWQQAEAELERQRDLLLQRDLDRERRWEARAADREREDRDRAREIVQLQQQLIDAKMALAQSLSEHEQKYLTIKAHEMALSQTKLELAQVRCASVTTMPETYE